MNDQEENAGAETTAALEARLAGVKAKRGYLLPHHGLLALTFPRLLEGYDAAYSAMALDDRVLSHHDREFVWLAVLAATGDDALIGAAFAATALAIGAEAFDFAAHRWGAQLAPFDPRAAYLEAVAAIAPAAPRRLVHLAQCAVQVCRARWRVLEWQIEAAYADNVPEDEIAEAITLAMFPGSIPRFVEACGVWRSMIAAGRVAASERYRAWAALTGQGGFDEVLAKTSKDK